MTKFQHQYLVDEEGHRKAVVISISAWEQILAALDELEDIREYDETKQHPSQRIPFEQAVSEIGQGTRD